ncbi:flagellar basal body rod protein FlgF [Serratia sp. M24T3]|uniref:flagellar basal body rod protein FlgF n=1 Tax=Serratia sp. M24T3 TaxID=932213 RepID=UPI00025BBC9C|nr:flagellar basal body rod protein FlgF [Serratia sp. M24T3]EIC82575.1 flagellar basal body rod protein FlgF [Serratia sp. M24T3]
MDHLIYTAVSGATRSLDQQVIHANNLSNVNTQGFRADLESAQAQRITGAGYNTRYLVEEKNAGVDLTQGHADITGRDLDIAIRGAGLIAVHSDAGEAYTRNGLMNVNDSGELTIGGLAVLGDSGPIILPPYKHISVGSDGTISIIPADGDVSAEQDIDRIKLVDIAAKSLHKNAQGWLVASGRALARNDGVELEARHLEGSNVSAVSEMTASIALTRQFEAQIKMMKVAEELAEAGDRLLRNS